MSASKTHPEPLLRGRAPELDDARRLLQCGVDLEPPPGEDAAVWAALAASLPVAVASGAATTAAAKAVATKAAAANVAVVAGGGILKSALFGALAAVVVLGGYEIVAPTPVEAPAVARVAAASPREAPLTRAAAPSSPATAAPTSEPVAAPVASSDAARGASSSTAPPASAEASPGMRIEEEQRALTAAREALQRGDAAGALAELDRFGARFPRAQLAEEREALTIEALAKGGQQGAARARAEAFLRAHPQSWLAPRVRAIVE